MKETLLQETNLSLQKAIDMCRTSEFSKRQMRSITEEYKSVDFVNKVAATSDTKIPPKEKIGKERQKKTNSEPQKKCKQYGTFRAPRKCSAFGKTCHKRENRNHFASHCLSKDVHFVESNQAAQPVVDDQQLEELFIGHAQTDDHEQEWKVLIQVKNNLIYFILKWILEHKQT